jgi:hypothetical protein
LPLLYGVMVRRVFPVALARTLDRSIYNGGKGRMWRLPNRLRTDTKRYKVPVSVREILAQSSTDLDALTTQPRRGVFWATGNLHPCAGLAHIYREVAANPPRHHAMGPRLAPGAPILSGARHTTMLRLAGAMRRQGAEADVILAALLVHNRRCTPPLDETELEGIAREVSVRYAPVDHHLPEKRGLGFRTVNSREMRPWQR